MGKFRIGSHISLFNGFINTPMYGKSIGCDIIQIFLSAPQQIATKVRPKEELEKFGSELKKYKLKVVIHGSYTINLCNPPTNKLFESSVKSLIQDLNATKIIGKRCIGVIIHMGKNVSGNGITYQQAMKNYVDGLKKVLSQTDTSTIIILETGASQGTEVASKLDDLAKIYHSFKSNDKQRLKFCIDTCHIWSTGYDISTPDNVNKFFNEFDKKIGINRIACIHFNDSKTPLGAHVDRHADIGYGYIKVVGLKEVVRFAFKHKIPILIETPLDSVNIKTNKDVTFEEQLDMIKSWIR